MHLSAKDANHFWLLPLKTQAKEQSLSLPSRYPEVSLFHWLLGVWTNSSHCQLTEKQKHNSMVLKYFQKRKIDNVRLLLMMQLKNRRGQTDVREIKSQTTQNTIIHEGEMASVKGAWVGANLDFEWTTLGPSVPMLILHRLKCLPPPPGKSTKQQWSNEGLRGCFCLCSQALISC